ncbi:MAG TPA: tetratricopeptide repeat protein [Steroidobacteraceae bacterium]|nr:tetratricopeptide repeat protein [Steroidobacteraceae bacterium]
MRSYSVRDVERVLRLSPDITRNLIKAGFVKPARGARREYRFSFQDLIVLRTARALIDARIPAKRIRRSLESLRRELPDSVPLSGLSISAVGEHVVVRDGESRRRVDSGQYLLGLDVSLENGELHVVERREDAPASVPQAGADWFAEALRLEASDPQAALAAYGRVVGDDAQHSAAWINWGRLLHEQGRTEEAREVYARALAAVGPDALLLFNQGVLLEDLGDADAALTAYQTALQEDPDLADCHYNLARLYESRGLAQHAIRHLGQYRRLVAGDSR